MLRIPRAALTPRTTRPVIKLTEITGLQLQARNLQRSVGNHTLARTGATGARPAQAQPDVIRAIVQRAIVQRATSVQPAPARHEGSDLFFHTSAATPRTSADHAAPPPAARPQSRDTIQRLAWNDQPFPDVRPTPARFMTKSGTGQDGVYFVREGSERVVLKLQAPEEAYRTQVANQFMQIGAGLVAPHAVVLAANSAGNTAIKAAILAHSTLDQPGTAPELVRAVNARLKSDAAAAAGDPSTSVVVMDAIQQVSLSEMVKDPAQHNGLVHALTNPTVVRGFAKIIVADAILNNTDRFIKGIAFDNPVVDAPANISNIFVSPDFSESIALDNDTFNAGYIDPSDIGRLDASLQRRSAQMRALANPHVADQLAEAVVCSCMFEAGELAPQQVVSGLSNRGRGPLSTLLHRANTTNVLSTLLAKELKRQVDEITKTMRDNRKQLRAAHGAAAASSGLANPSHDADYNQLRARAKYLKMRMDGAKEADALVAMRKHLLHKEQKDAGQLPRQKAGKKIAAIFGI